jgi:flagellar M-ring protein FliF
MNPLGQFRAASPTRQITLVGIGAVLLCAILIAVYWTTLRKPYGVLFTDLRTMDAATIVAELDKKKVPYKLQDQGATILIPREQVDATRLSVMSEDLPLKGMVGFELFNKSDMGLTEFAQKINYQRALQGELARTIMTMEAIDTARVHLSLPEATIFRADQRPPKASVSLTPRAGKQLAPGTVRGIQRLVAAAVPDLTVADVVVLDEQGDVVSTEPAQPTMVGVDSVRGELEARVRRAVQDILPADRFTVVVLSGHARGADQQDRVNGDAPTVRQGVRVDVTLAEPVSPEVQEQVRRLAEQAIGADPAAGDLVTVGVSSALMGPVAAEPAIPPPVGPPPAPRAWGTSPALEAPAPLTLPLIYGGVLVVLLLLAWLLHRSRPVARRLDPEEQQSYADRLKALLDEGEAVANPRY